MESKRTLSRPVHDRSKKPRLKQDPDFSPPLLNLGRKVFLSHSGKDKDFVRFLYERLCWHYHDRVAFFDEKSLPKAKEVSMENILEEARRCELGVLVLTEHFFTHTKNPMRELEAFVASGVKLLPLFLGMSVDEFKQKDRRDAWEKRWRDAFGLDEEVIKKWREAIDRVSAFCGLEYCKIATDTSDYVHSIVREVTRIVGPAVPFCQQGVRGKERLCEEVNGMYKTCASKRSSRVDCMPSTQVASTSASPGRREDGDCTLDLVGIYGFAGLGKTTLCKCLCDFFFAEFNGKVCHVDLAQSPPNSLRDSNIYRKQARMLHVLSTLTGYNDGYHHSRGQVKNLLTERISRTEGPVFLAIDNILPAEESQEEADFYLSCEFRKGSKIFITSRSESILTNLTSQHSCTFSAVIEYMPKLCFKEARDILVHEFPDLRKKGFSNLGDELQRDVNACVDMCTIHWKRYHPVMLKSLAAYVRWNRRYKADWKERLRALTLEGILDTSDAWGRVFRLLDITYNLMSEEAKHVFLELALLPSSTRFWFSHVRVSLRGFCSDTTIWSELHDLGFVEGRGQLEIPDLLVEFCKYKVRQEGAVPRYVVAQEERWITTHAQCVFPKSVRSVSISRCRKALGSTLDMTRMKKPRVLYLVDNPGLQQVLLSSAACFHLRSLIVMVPEDSSLCFTLMDGDSPNTLAQAGNLPAGSSLCFAFMNGDWPSTQVEAGNLQVLLLHGNVSFQSGPGLQMMAIKSPLEMYLGRKLGLLSLSDVPSVHSIDVTSCVNLKELHLRALPGLRSARCPANSRLKDCSIIRCEELRELTFSDENHNLSSACTYARDPNLHLRLCDLPHLSCISGLEKSTSLCIQSCERLPVLAMRFDCQTCRIFDSDADTRDVFDMFEEYADDEYPDPGRRLGTPQPLLGGLWLADNIAGVDPSICKARVCEFDAKSAEESGPCTMVTRMILQDAQHIALFISALLLNTECLRALEKLSITCSTHSGGCGCDQSPPHFGASGYIQSPNTSKYWGPEFIYHCPQVRDLTSLAQWRLLQYLDLSGCTSVEVWPDFGAMTSLIILDLSNTSLKKWPAGVQLLDGLEELYISLCSQLSTQELTRVTRVRKFQFKSRSAYVTCIQSFLQSLTCDWRAGIRAKTCSIADAVNALSPELLDMCEDWDFWHFEPPERFGTYVVDDRKESVIYGMERPPGVGVWTLVHVLYEMWPFKDDVREGEYTRTEMRRLLRSMYTRTKMRRLLCSTSFWSLASSAMHKYIRWSTIGGDFLLEGIGLMGAVFDYYNIARVNNDIRPRVTDCINKAFDELKNEKWDTQLLRRSREAVYTIHRRLQEPCPMTQLFTQIGKYEEEDSGDEDYLIGDEENKTTEDTMDDNDE